MVTENQKNAQTPTEASPSQEPLLCGDGKFCHWLEGQFTEPNTKGMNAVLAIDANKNIQTLGVNYKRREKDEGLMFRFCPYCGEKIDYYNNVDRKLLETA